MSLALEIVNKYIGITFGVSTDNAESFERDSASLLTYDLLHSTDILLMMNIRCVWN
jgi:hypothetical protein